MHRKELEQLKSGKEKILVIEPVNFENEFVIT